MRAGEVVGLGGLVGSGRTELLRLIYGLDTPEEGEVWVDGKTLPPSRPDRAIAAGLGLAPEDRKSQGLLLDWSLTKNVSLADLGRFRRGLLDIRAERAAAREQLRRSTPCPTTPTAIARELSGGNQQKVVLARWLLRECRVLLLDEPTRGVDVATKAEIYRLITDLAGRPRRAGRLLRAGGAGRASAPASSSCARASSSPRSPATRRPSASCCATPSRPPIPPDLVEEVE